MKKCISNKLVFLWCSIKFSKGNLNSAVCIWSHRKFLLWDVKNPAGFFQNHQIPKYFLGSASGISFWVWCHFKIKCVPFKNIHAWVLLVLSNEARRRFGSLTYIHVILMHTITVFSKFHLLWSHSHWYLSSTQVLIQNFSF